MATKPERLGRPSKNFAHLGVHNVCMGPKAPTLPGPYLQIVIYDPDNNIVRRMEEREREIVPAYISFFEEASSPGVYQYYLVDIDPDGKETVIHSDPKALARDPQAWRAFLQQWAERYGVPQ